MNKYLIVLAGSPRGGEKTYISMYKNVKEHLKADLAICTTEDMYDDKISLFDKSDYQWILKNYENFFDYYKENFDGNWREFFDKGKGTGLYESGSIHFVFKDFILRNYLDILEKYDFIIYTRFDQFYLDVHIQGEENKVLIPKGEDYFGVCDRHAVVPKQYISKFLNICEFIDSNQSLNIKSEYLNCETAYIHHLHHEGLSNHIKRYSRTQFTAAFRTDRTNWRIPKFKLYFFNKLMIKYPDEFIESFDNLTNKKSHINLLFNKNILYFNYLYLKLRRFLGFVKNKF